MNGDNGGSALGNMGAGEDTDDHVSRFHAYSLRSRDSDSSRLRKDAAVASRKSSSDQASDQSTGRPAAKSANCVAHSKIWSAVPGGKTRIVSTNCSSFSVSR